MESYVQPIYLTDFGTQGADLQGIFYLRNVVDADKIVAAIADAKTKSNKVSSNIQHLVSMLDRANQHSTPLMEQINSMRKVLVLCVWEIIAALVSVGCPKLTCGCRRQ